jgi:hypothetical protein
VRVFKVTGAARVTLAGLTVAHGNDSSDECEGSCGGGIKIEAGASVTLTHSTLSGNSADAGGGIFNEGGTLTLNHSTLSSNSAVFEGGGIRNYGGTLTLQNSTLSGNSVDYYAFVST